MDLRLYLFLSINSTLMIIKINNSTVRLNKTDRERFRKMLTDLIPQMEKIRNCESFTPEKLSIIL